MAIAAQSSPLPNLATSLIGDGLLNETDANRYVIQARDQGKSLFKQLYDSGAISPEPLLSAAAAEFGMPLLDINALDRKELRSDLLADKVVKTLNVLPLFKRGSKLFTAVGDPENLYSLDEVKFQTGLGIEPILVDQRAMAKLIDEITAKPAPELLIKDTAEETDYSLEGLEELEIEAEAEAEGESQEAEIDTPVVRFVSRVFLDAIAKKVSDIHIEPYEKKTRIRYRIDGILHEVASPPLAMHPRLVSRIKILGRMNVAERRIPQDGRIKMKVAGGKTIDFRASTCPTLYGEKVVLRILNTDNAMLNVHSLGFEPDQLEKFMSAIKRPYGMVLVTGPTGSGKTVSLYAALNILNTPDRNISTIEDPVEINLHGVNQVNINPKANLTFATALKSFLRQDPDIIMLGEIRDKETADIGIAASQTGHLLFSTLHTNDAPSTLTRLLNMGVEPFNVASSVKLILAQRLLRKICSQCKQPADLPPDALRLAGFSDEDAETVTVYEAPGCSNCVGGFSGRSGIYEILPISEETEQIIMQGGLQNDIEKQAKIENMIDLRQAGLLKVKAGVTTLSEVERVTNV